MRGSRPIHLLAAAAALLLAAGCASTSSGNVATPGLYATFVVTGDSGTGAKAKAILQVGGPLGTYVDLAAGDALSVDGLPLSRHAALALVDYRRDDLPYKPAGDYRFLFTRSGESHEARVPLPAPMVVTAPAPGALHKRGTALPVTWTAGDGTTVDLGYTLSRTSGGASSTHGQAHHVADTGSFTFPAAESLPDATTVGPGTWEATLVVTRNRPGPAPATLEGATRGEQETTIRFFLVE